LFTPTIKTIKRYGEIFDNSIYIRPNPSPPGKALGRLLGKHAQAIVLGHDHVAGSPSYP
jgi:hypothetical protein